jgi:hypothetical protein
VSEEPDVAPAAAGARHYVTHTDSYTEYGWSYPDDSLYTVSVTTKDWFDGSAAGNVWVNKHCEATGWKGWSCPTGLAQKAGTYWDPSEYGGAQTAWGDFITEFHYPCPVCSEQDQTYIRIWVTPSGSYYHWEGH